MNAGVPLSPSASSHSRIAIVLCSIVALVAVLALRLTGPSDLYDQTQPKTIAYTTDIIVHGGSHWVLPVERGELPATKPPLYNWLAAPGVKWMGFNSEIAHKLPSTAAMLACWLLLVRLGRGIRCDELGWLAAMMFASSYAIFKLGFLARPDMLLMLWMLIAWICATREFITNSRGGNAVVFWLAVALAGLTKGPAAFVIVVYALLAARYVAGDWRAIRRLHPAVGMLFTLLVCGAWVYGVWRINPTHLKQELWFNEIYGRVTGTGREGAREGTLVWLREMPYLSFYFITRFLPWTIFAILATWVMWRNRQRTVIGPSSANPTRAPDLWMRAAAMFMLLTIGLFSLSVGKRSDYVAIAYPQTALLAAWWLQRDSTREFLLGFKLTPPIAATTLAALSLAFVSYYDHQQIWAPQPGFGNAIRQFVDESTTAMAARPSPVLNVSAGQTHLQAVLGIAEADQRREIANTIELGEAFWVIAGRTQNAPHEFDLWLRQRRMPATAEAVVRSTELPRDAGWPGQVTLWRVTPR